MTPNKRKEQSFQQIVSKKEVKDAHFEELAKTSAKSELNKSRMLRRTKKLEETMQRTHIDLDKLKEAVWTGVPSSKFSKS